MSESIYAWVNQAAELRRGGMKWKKIAATLNKQGYVNARKGGKIIPATVSGYVLEAYPELRKIHDRKKRVLSGKIQRKLDEPKKEPTDIIERLLSLGLPVKQTAKLIRAVV